MKMVCILCKQERELSVEEIKEYGEWIENKNLQAVDYLNRIGLEDGYTCRFELDTETGTRIKKHKYEFEEEWDKVVHKAAANIILTGTLREESIKRAAELQSKINEMALEKAKEEEKTFELDKGCGVSGDLLMEMTGNKKYELWI